MPQPESTYSRTRQLCLLATTDMHMHLTGWDYAKDRLQAKGGLVRLAGAIEQARTEAAATGADLLLFDNGDGSQGTALGDPAILEAAAAKGTVDAVHPLTRAFEDLRYDAIGLGNHDFDFGVAHLQSIVAASPCPVLCSNLLRTVPDDLAEVADSVILTVGPAEAPVRVGVLSALPPQTRRWNADVLGNRIQFEDIIPSIERGAAQLRAAGCDLVVALAHTGFSELGPAGDGHGDTENVLGAVTALRGLDAVFGGHTHLPFAGWAQDGRTPVAAAGHAALQLARIDLTLNRGRDGWRVAHGTASLVDAPASEGLESPRLSRTLGPWHKATRAAMNQSCGYSERNLNSYFSLIRPDAHLHLLAEAQHRAAMLGCGLAGDLPVLSAVAPGKSGGRGGPDNYADVPSGPILRRHVEGLVPFANSLRAIRITGRALKVWLEMSAGVFNTLGKCPDPIDLQDRDWPAHGFDTIFGLRYRIDVGRPPAFRPNGTRTGAGFGRIRDLACNGRSVAPEDQFVVLVNNYRANGGGNVPGLVDAPRVELPDIDLRDAVAAFLSNPSPPVFDPDPWELFGADGARATVLTGPECRPLLAEVSSFAPEVGPIDCDGFLPVTITL